MDSLEAAYEIGADGIGEKQDLRMRAWYSANPAFIEGSETTPDGHDDIELAVVLDGAANKINGREEEVLHALRYMRVREGREDQDFVILNHDLALKGLRWIRKNIKAEDIHRSVIEAKTEIEKHSLKQNRSLIVSNAGSEPVDSVVTIKSKRAKEREELQRQRAEAQLEHEQQRQVEIDRLTQWQEEHPPGGTNYYMDMWEHLGTRVSTNGEVLIDDKSDSGNLVHAQVNYMARNPNELFQEFNDSDNLHRFFAENDVPILEKMYNHIVDSEKENWRTLSFDKPEDLKEIAPLWFSVFRDFSDEYKSSVDITPTTIDNNYAKKQAPPMQDEAYVMDYGTRLIYNSLIASAESHPEDFLELVHDVMKYAVDQQDEFVRKSALFAITGALSKSNIGNLLLLEAPIAMRLDHLSKLKSIDLILLFEDEGCVVPRPAPGTRKLMPHKLVKKYGTVEEIVASFRINPHTQGLSSKRGIKGKLREQVYIPLESEVKGGGLPGSLFLRVKDQKISLPEDA